MRRIRSFFLFLVLLLIISTPIIVAAATPPVTQIDPPIDLAKLYGGTSQDVFYDIKPIPGGSIAVGTTMSPDGDFAYSATFGTDALIVKLDGSGNVVWHKYINPGVFDIFRSVELAADGGFIAVGVSSDMSYIYDCLAAKFDASGTMVWTKVLGSSGQDNFLDAVIAADGNVVIAGMAEHYPLADYGGLRNGLVVKLDQTNGDVIWEKPFGGATAASESTVFNSIVRSADNGFVVSGYTAANDGDFTGETLNGGNDAVAVKLDANGNRVWSEVVGGSDAESFLSITQLASGNYLAVGYTRSKDGDFTRTSTSGGQDIVAAIISDSGTFTSFQTIDGNSDERLLRIVNCADGGAIAFGLSDSTTGELTGSMGGYDGVAVKIAGDGSFSWLTRFGGSEEDNFWSGYPISSTQFAAVGFANSNDGDVAGLNKSIPASLSKNDAWLTVFTVAPTDTTGPALTLTPNIATSTNQNITITVTGTDPSGVQEITLPGPTVVPATGTSFSTTFTVSGNGTYTVTAKDSIGNTSSKSITISNIDKTPPEITIAPYDGTTPTSSDITVTASTNEGTLNTDSHTFTANGSFDFIATDAAGNVTTKTVTISNIDKTPPAILSIAGTQRILTAGTSELTVLVKTTHIPVGSSVLFTLLNANHQPLTVPISGTAPVDANGEARIVVILPDGFTPGAYYLAAAVGETNLQLEAPITIVEAEIPQTGEISPGLLPFILLTLAAALAVSRRRRMVRDN